ncbi:MAG: hypothetical protein KOO61_04710 [Spirochaetales bacterium]|nr:hypothetical protein [Spirochaetales bacterium]
MGDSSKGLSIAAYAEHRKRLGLPGGSPWSVKKALRDQRIGKNQHGKIDPETADQQWDKNTNPAQVRDPAVLAEKAVQRLQKTKQPPGPDNSGIPSYSQSRAVKEAYQARIARLQYEEMTGQLVKVSEVKVEAFKRARTARDQILSVPDRVASIIAAEEDPDTVRDVLDDELRKALEVLANV